MGSLSPKHRKGPSSDGVKLRTCRKKGVGPRFKGKMLLGSIQTHPKRAQPSSLGHGNLTRTESFGWYKGCPK